MFGESAHGVEAASRLLKKSIRGLFDSDHPWPSPYGRYQVAPNFSPGEIVNTQSKKRPLLRLPALATHREVQVSREAGCRERPAFVHPAQHGFCFASFFKHLACLKNGGTSLYRDGQEALVPCSAGRRESGHRRVMKNEFFITLLSADGNPLA